MTGLTQFIQNAINEEYYTKGRKNGYYCPFAAAIYDAVYDRFKKEIVKFIDKSSTFKPFKSTLMDEDILKSWLDYAFYGDRRGWHFSPFNEIIGALQEGKISRQLKFSVWNYSGMKFLKNLAVSGVDGFNQYWTGRDYDFPDEVEDDMWNLRNDGPLFEMNEPIKVDGEEAGTLIIKKGSGKPAVDVIFRPNKTFFEQHPEAIESELMKRFKDY